jgi:hypothetical protein
VTELRAGAPDSRETGAGAYELWLRLAPGGEPGGWVQAAVPSDRETGTDGRPSSIDLPLVLSGE